MANKYVTDNEVAQYLRLDISDSAVLADMQAFIAVSEDIIEQYCNVVDFVYTTGDVGILMSGHGTNILSLPRFLNSLTKVEFVNLNGDVLSQLNYASPQPQPYRDGGYRWLETVGNFPYGLNNLLVTGKWGLNPIPPRLKMAVKIQTKFFYDTVNAPMNVVLEKTMNHSVQYARVDDVVPKIVQSLAAPLILTSKFTTEQPVKAISRVPYGYGHM